MALGQFTKQLAQQAIGDHVKDMLDSLRPADLSALSESAKSAKPAAAQAETVSAIVLGQVQAMQKALKEGEELVVLCYAGAETMRVLEFFVPAWSVVVLTGIDPQRNITRIVSPIESLQLVCKVMKAAPDAKPIQLRFLMPKPKSE
ncbi:MAG: hypothetical protein ABI165_15530 [Bryobacteraceae bacterium]